MASYFQLDEIPGVRFPWHGRPKPEDWVKLKQYVYARDHGICAYCGQQAEYAETHCHHTLELSEGGTNHPSNLKTVHVRCHKARHPFMKSVRDRLHPE